MKLEYLFIKPENNYYTTEDAFKKFLSSNSRIVFETADTLKLDDSKLKYSLKLTNVEKSKELIFHFSVDASGNETEQIALLEKFDLLINEINTTCGHLFAINRIWNDVSIYYGKKLYPEILNIENLLRKIIYLFMLKTVGSKWLDTNTPEKFQSSITAVIEKNNKKKQDITEEWLTYADFITLGYFFTAPYSLKSDLSKLFDELKKYQSEESEPQTTSTNKKKAKHVVTPLTAAVIEQLSNEYAPKNNWERYFSDKLKVKSPNKFSNDWGSLYDIRNKVAHGKPLDKATYEKATELINTYSSSFTECISIIDTLEITIEQAEAVEAIAQQVIPQEPSSSYKNESELIPTLSLYSADVLGSELRINEPSLATEIIKLSKTEPTDSVLIDPNILHDYLIPNAGISSLVDGISQTTKAANPLLEYPGLLQTTSQLERSIPPLSQITIPTSLGLTLNPSRVSAALDTPLFFSSKLPTPDIITATEHLAETLKKPLSQSIKSTKSLETYKK